MKYMFLIDNNVYLFVSKLRIKILLKSDWFDQTSFFLPGNTSIIFKIGIGECFNSIRFLL